MFDKIDYQIYDERNNFVKKFHPYNLVILTFLISFLTILENSIYGQCTLFVGIIILLILNKENIIHYLKMIFYLKYFIIGIVILNIYFYTNYNLLIVSILKVVNVLLFTKFMMKNIKLQDMTDGLTILLTPIRIFHINPSKIAFSLSLAIHFIPLILKEGNKLWKSLASRGILLEKISFFKRLKMLKVLLIPLFTKTIQIADQLANTMTVRLYDISSYQKIEVTNWKNRDSLLLMCILYIILIIFIKEVVL